MEFHAKSLTFVRKKSHAFSHEQKDQLSCILSIHCHFNKRQTSMHCIYAYQSDKEFHSYTRSFSTPLLKCVDKTQAEYILVELHNEICDLHSGGRNMATRALRVGYY